MICFKFAERIVLALDVHDEDPSEERGPHAEADAHNTTLYLPFSLSSLFLKDLLFHTKIRIKIIYTITKKTLSLKEIMEELLPV